MPAQTVIKLRRDTAANWDSINPVLASGEMGVETDTGLHKFGNGTSAWGALPYAASSKIVQQVKNSSGSTMAKGSVVYISGATGGDALVTLADADSEMTSSKTLGLLASAIDNDAYGNVIEQGLLSGVNTASATAGQSVWLSSTAGQFVFGNPPAKPAHSVYLGVVTRVHATEGEILVKVQNGYELNELHDVNASSPSTGDALVWDGSAWVNQQIDVSSAIEAHNLDTTSVHGIADTSELATKTYADGAAAAAVAALVDSAPSTLDTLNELAAALGDDANFATTVTGQIAAKQDKVSGVSDTEIGYLDGVTSSIQTQLNGKAATSHTHSLANISDVTISTTEINSLDGIQDNVQSLLDSKAGLSNSELTAPVLNNPTIKTLVFTTDPFRFTITNSSTLITDFVQDSNFNPNNPFYFVTGPGPISAIGQIQLKIISWSSNQILFVAFNEKDRASLENLWAGSALNATIQIDQEYNSDGIYTSVYAENVNFEASTTGTILLPSLGTKLSNRDVAKALGPRTVSDISSNYTIIQDDASRLIRSTSGAVTVTVPNVLADGQSIDFLQTGTGQITFAGSGVTINSADAKLKTAKQYAAATLLKAGGAYYLIGNLG